MQKKTTITQTNVFTCQTRENNSLIKVCDAVMQNIYVHCNEIFEINILKEQKKKQMYAS